MKECGPPDEYETRNVTGKFLQKPHVGDVFVNAARATDFIPRYRVTKVNSKSVRLVGIDRKLDFVVRLSNKAVRAVFTIAREALGVK